MNAKFPATISNEINNKPHSEIFRLTIAFHVDFGYSLFYRCTPKQHEERTLARRLRRGMKEINGAPDHLTQGECLTTN